MSLIYSAESAASPSDSSAQGCEPSHSAKSNPTAAPSCESTGRTSPAMTTSEHSPQSDWLKMQSRLMSSWAVSRAKTFPAPARKLDFPGIEAAYGENFPVLLARYDRDSSLWKTSQTCFLEGLETFSETWPRSGMTRNGTAYQLPTLAYRSLATASGLLPTLTATDARGGRNATAKGRSLADGITMTDWLWLNIGRGRLHPESAEWMMGYPTGHTDLDPSATPSSRKSRNSSAARSCKPLERMPERE